MLIGHGRLLGYAEASSERVLRGHRLLCSNRRLRRGCGRTVSIWLTTIVRRRVVRTATVLALFTAIANGTCVSTAWRLASSMTLRTGYRIRLRLAQHGAAIRTALLSRAPPPRVDSTCADVQLLSHVRAVLGTSGDAFAAYQSMFQEPLLG